MVFFHLMSCSKDGSTGVGDLPAIPLFSFADTSAVYSLQLYYDVVIERNTTFKNGIGAAAPGWKKLEAIPETESYSLTVNISDGSTYMLKDNIVVRSDLEDRLLPEDRMAKLEIQGGTITSYNALGGIMSSIPESNVAQGLMEGITKGFYNSPVNTSELSAKGINYSVHGNRVIVTTSIANGDGSNSTLMLDKGTGMIILELLYDDTYPDKPVSVSSHKYGGNGELLTSSFTHYEYLSDGDVKKTDEKWTYSNFSFTFN